MNRAGGFTLVELIVAVTVLAVGLLSLVGTNAHLTRLLSAGDRAATATFYAQDRLETLRATDCAAISAGAETRGGVYALAWEVAPAANGNVRRVLLTVSYPSRPGTVRVDTLETSVLCIR